MNLINYLIILVYFIGLLVLGATLGKKIKSSKEMFIAGRNSSWWLSGLSTYMTIFSAGTFVVWGGVAYRSGIVAIVVALMLGIACIGVGKLLASKWSRININSPAEYLTIRFGQRTVRFYTIIGIIGRGVSTAVALYAIVIMVVVLMPLPPNNFLADPATGHLSVTWAILIMGAITFIYTAAGGFIAVLMTDVIQFAVLMAMIIIMVPLSFGSVGGITDFIAKAPTGFFSPFSEQYSFLWMILWCILNFFMIGGDWAFVQRYISVPTPKDARKSIYLVGALYMTTPLLWYIPTLTYREINPLANPEQAYMLMSQHVLGVGMVGLMLAAMMSATLSLVSGTLNVFANVFTYDIFKKFYPKSSDKTLMHIGRLFTYLFGIVITLFAILIPYLGGAERVIVMILTLVISPLFIPSVWGLFSKKIGCKSVWLSLGITYGIALLVKFGVLFKDFATTHEELTDAFIGLVIPVTILLVMEWLMRKRDIDSGWNRVHHIMMEEKEVTDEAEKEKNKKAGRIYSNMAMKLMIGTYAAVGTVILAISLIDKQNQANLLIYGSLFLGVSIIAYIGFYWYTRKHNK